MRNNIPDPTIITLNGVVTSSYGKRYDVTLEDNSIVSCITRGKKNDIACGDNVSIKRTATHEGVIENFAPRRTLLYRSNTHKSKFLAANISQVIIVVAAKPSFYVELVNRSIVAAEAAGIQVLVVLNKCDLTESELALPLLNGYAKLGYNTLAMSAAENIAPLKPFLANQQSLLIGQSGMGKSTIINALLPHNKAVRTREMSETLDSGKHTTTATHLYALDSTSHLIDSPGLQEFGLHHLGLEEIERAFVEFRPLLGHCRFNNCRHLSEPDCTILNAVKAGEILEHRYASFKSLSAEYWGRQSAGF